jgi:hypothetical protein
MNHFTAHQQALVKDNLVTVVLAFPDHDNQLMAEIFAKFEYDLIVDLCLVQKNAYVGSAWDGQDFNVNYLPSWVLGDDLKWHAPISMPDDGKDYIWDEIATSWLEVVPEPLPEAQA